METLKCIYLFSNLFQRQVLEVGWVSYKLLFIIYNNLLG